MSWLGQPRRHLESCASTNDEAAAWARAGAPAGAIVIADQQTRGRGRLGRVWHAPPGASLLLSVVLRPPLAPHQLPPLTLAAGVALAETVASLGPAPSLKWPNDVLLDGKKVAGILTEMATQGARVEHVIIGIGINLTVEDFPDEIAARATSLHRHAPVERDTFLEILCARLEVWHDRFVADGPAPVVEAWKGFARFLGERVQVTSGSERLAGVAEDLDGEGALLLRTDAGLRRVLAGELA